MKCTAIVTTLVTGILFSFVTVSTVSAQDADRAEKRAAWKEKMFNKMDINGDGTVTEEEFLQAHAERAKKRFEKIDADSDGVITKEEFDTAKSKHRGHKKGWKGKKHHCEDHKE